VFVGFSGFLSQSILGLHGDVIAFAVVVFCSTETVVPGLPPVDAATALTTKNADTVATGIRVFRLKDKLGTRQLPTAEMELTGVCLIVAISLFVCYLNSLLLTCLVAESCVLTCLCFR
jgi:hypothetical protein